MKICIDGVGITLLKGTGLYSYTYELLENLFEMYPQPDYEIIWDEESEIEKWNRYKKITWVNLDRKENINEVIEKHVEENKIKILHSPNNGFSLPWNKGKHNGVKRVFTAHDLIAKSKQELVDSKYLNRFHKVFPIALENADRIVAVSNFIKNELKEYYKVPEEKIEVIYPGCGERFHYLEGEEGRAFLRDTYNIEGKIILFAGSLHKRKNLKRLLKIFKDISLQDKELKLILAGKNDGKRHEHYLELKQQVRDLQLEDRVYFTGTVDYTHMPYFYNSSICTVNLSDYEGFPMSSIESLSCGTPVICSNTSSFEEVLNGKGILVHSNNEKEIKEAILGVMYDRDYKKEVVENSSKVREKYNWTKAIKKYVRLYEELAQEV